MSLNRYRGICFRCGKEVPPSKGDFQAIRTLPKKLKAVLLGKWVVRCFGCKKLGNIPIETSPYYQP